MLIDIVRKHNVLINVSNSTDEVVTYVKHCIKFYLQCNSMDRLIIVNYIKTPINYDQTKTHKLLMCNHKLFFQTASDHDLNTSLNPKTIVQVHLKVNGYVDFPPYSHLFPPCPNTSSFVFDHNSND